MKHIIKDTEPQVLTNWKNSNPTVNDYERLDLLTRRTLRNHLIAVQGEICCYCESRVTLNASHIEHIKPRSNRNYQHLQLDYNNMLCSCLDEISIGNPVHCGKKKNRWYIDHTFVSPLNPICESKFKYYDDGTIEPVDLTDIAACETIDHLALNISKLVRNRKAAIDEITIYISENNIDNGNQYVAHIAALLDSHPFCEYWSAIKYIFHIEQQHPET